METFWTKLVPDRSPKMTMPKRKKDFKPKSEEKISIS